MMRYIVIGGNGFVGSGYVNYLKKLGEDVLVVDRQNYNSLMGSSCDVLINANGNSKKYLAVQDPKEEFQASVVSVRNSLVDFKFKKYVFLSTSDVYPDCSRPDLTREDMALNVAQQSPYGFHKYMAELCVQHAAKDWLIIRQGGFVGSGMKKNAVFDVLYGDKLWVHPDSRFQYINTIDSARLILSLVDKGVINQIINLTATGTISAREIMQLAKKDLPYESSASPVCYEISTTKASQYLSLPSSYETVGKFLRENMA